MSRTVALRSAIVVAVLLLAWGGLALVHAPEPAKPHEIALPPLDTAAVDTITLADSADTTVLTRDLNGRWLADGYRADAGAVGALLGGLADTGWSDLVSQSLSLRVPLRVSDQDGRRLEVRGRGAVMLDLLTGKPLPSGGVYVRLARTDPIYALHGRLADALTRVGSWHDRHVAEVIADSVGSIEVERGTRYTLSRSGTTWRLGSGKAADSEAVAALLAQYRSLNALDFVRPSTVVPPPAGPPIHVRLTDRAGRPLLGLTLDSAWNGVTARLDSGGVKFRLDPWLAASLAPPESAIVSKSGK